MTRPNRRRPTRCLRIESLEPRAMLDGSTEPLSINIAPSFTKGPDPAVLEDSGSHTIENWASDISPGDASESSHIVAFEVLTDKPELFAALPSILPTGTLSFQPAHDVSGMATVTVRLIDDGGTAEGGQDTSSPQTFTITISPVNDQPTFDAGDPPAVDEDSGVHTIKFWALFEPGAADELNQRGPIYEVVGVGRPDLFAELPKVSKTLGTLTYKLKPDAFGTSTIDVIVRDSGGTTDGGINVSAAQRFTITVNGVNDPPQAHEDWLSVAEDSQDQILDVLANDSILPDVDETLTITGIGAAKYGTAAIVAGGTRIQYTPPLNFVGRDSLEYTISDGSGGIDTATLTINVLNRPDEIMVVAPGAGAPPEVVVIDPATGDESFRFFAFHEKFRGGVRVATGDVTGDGTPDIIAGAGPGGGPHVRVFDGATGQQVDSPVGNFMAFSMGFGGGVYVAAGDVDGDGRDDVIVSADEGGGPHVRVFSGADGAELMSFFAYAPHFGGGVRVAAADLNSDGFADLITAAGPGGGPHVLVISGQDGSLLQSFFAYNIRFTGGVFVAAGDVDGGGLEDIITGAGAGGGPHVRAFGGADNSIKANFFAYEGDYRGGVPVAATDTDGLNGSEIVVGHGPRQDGQVRVFKRNGTLVGETDVLPGFEGAAHVAGSAFAIRGPGSNNDGFFGSITTSNGGSNGGTTGIIFTNDPFDLDIHPPITDAHVDSLRTAVIARWEEAGLDPRIARLFHFVEIHLNDFHDTLGYLQNNDIYLDNDASYDVFGAVVNGTANTGGWFVDPTPLDDEEFTMSPNGALVASGGDAIGRLDLVSVLSHMFGELLGVPSIAEFQNHNLDRTFPSGLRRPVDPAHVDAIFAEQ